MTVMTAGQAATAKLAGFDYSEPAELFGGGRWTGRPAMISYRRFDTSAEAIRFAIEELDEAARRPCVLEVNEKRFDHADLRRLYDSRRYPLPRESGKDDDAT